MIFISLIIFFFFTSNSSAEIIPSSFSLDSFNISSVDELVDNELDNFFVCGMMGRFANDKSRKTKGRDGNRFNI